jgi:hypothetical protein
MQLGFRIVRVGTTALGWILCAVLLGAAVVWIVYAQPWEKGAPLELSATEESE